MKKLLQKSSAFALVALFLGAFFILGSCATKPPKVAGPLPAVQPCADNSAELAAAEKRIGEFESALAAAEARIAELAKPQPRQVCPPCPECSPDLSGEVARLTAEIVACRKKLAAAEATAKAPSPAKQSWGPFK
ncbi:MAG: hypothetical protein ABIH35_04470 [Patescibacteria group bacterium]